MEGERKYDVKITLKTTVVRPLGTVFKDNVYRTEDTAELYPGVTDADIAGKATQNIVDRMGDVRRLVDRDGVRVVWFSDVEMWDHADDPAGFDNNDHTNWEAHFDHGYHDGSDLVMEAGIEIENVEYSYVDPNGARHLVIREDDGFTFTTIPITEEEWNAVA